MELLTPQDVQASLDALGLDCVVTVYETSTATSQEAADSIGTELGSIIKSLCFMINGNPIVCLTAGDQRIDDRKLASLYGVGRKKVRMASAEQTISETGYAVGGVPPLGHINKLPILIDRTLQRYETVYGAGGAANAIFPITFDTLVVVTQGQVADIVEDA